MKIKKSLILTTMLISAATFGCVKEATAHDLEPLLNNAADQVEEGTTPEAAAKWVMVQPELKDLLKKEIVELVETGKVQEIKRKKKK